MTVAELIKALEALQQDLPVVVTSGNGESAEDPDPRERFVVFKLGRPMWYVDPSNPDGAKVIWL